MHQHSARFIKVVNEARARVRECTINEVKGWLDAGEALYLIDVREDREYDVDHLPGATHLGKGIIERDIEQAIADTGAKIVLYCGGGYRSALAADSLQQMGYTAVWSMDGGIRGWREAGHPTES